MARSECAVAGVDEVLAGPGVGVAAFFRCASADMRGDLVNQCENGVLAERAV